MHFVLMIVFATSMAGSRYATTTFYHTEMQEFNTEAACLHGIEVDKKLRAAQSDRVTAKYECVPKG